jgi:plasmid stabilization system protein ParE
VKIEISPRAEADIIRQFRYYLVDQDAPATAFRFREAVIESVERLKHHPRMGTMFRGSISGLRSWPVRGFEALRIYYLKVPGSLRVVRVLHGKRNVRRILQQEKIAEE